MFDASVGDLVAPRNIDVCQSRQRRRQVLNAIIGDVMTSKHAYPEQIGGDPRGGGGNVKVE